MVLTMTARRRPSLTCTNREDSTMLVSCSFFNLQTAFLIKSTTTNGIAPFYRNLTMKHTIVCCWSESGGCANEGCNDSELHGQDFFRNNRIEILFYVGQRSVTLLRYSLKVGVKRFEVCSRTYGRGERLCVVTRYSYVLVPGTVKTANPLLMRKKKKIPRKNSSNTSKKPGYRQQFFFHSEIFEKELHSF